MGDTLQITIAIAISILVVILLVSVYLCTCFRKKKRNHSDDGSEQVDNLVPKSSALEPDTRKLGRRAWEEKGANPAFQSGSPMMRKKTIK
jgi:hypothetical protein